MKKIVLMMAAAVCLIGCGKKDAQATQEAERVEVVSTMILENHEIERVLNISTNLQGYLTQNVAPSLTGKIEHIFVEVGDRVKEGDMLVAFDTNYMDPVAIRNSLLRQSVESAAEEAFYQQTREQAADIIATFKNQNNIGIMDRLRSAGSQALELIDRVREFREVAEERTDSDFGDTYMSIIDRSFSIMNHHQTVRMIESITPDLLVRMPFDAYGDIADYAKAEQISQLGRRLMAEALDRYEAENV